MTDENEKPQAPAAIPQALLDHVIANYKEPADLIGENGLLRQLTKAVIEAALNAEMNQHLGHVRFAILLLHGPKQAACLVEADIVRPTVQWRKPLLPFACAATTEARPRQTANVRMRFIFVFFPVV